MVLNVHRNRTAGTGRRWGWGGGGGGEGVWRRGKREIIIIPIATLSPPG